MKSLYRTATLFLQNAKQNSIFSSFFFLIFNSLRHNPKRHKLRRFHLLTSSLEKAFLSDLLFFKFPKILEIGQNLHFKWRVEFVSCVWVVYVFAGSYFNVFYYVTMCTEPFDLSTLLSDRFLESV